MRFNARTLLTNPEKRARLLFWIWIISMAMTVFGYLLIFYILL
jgi:hypothetical protein